MMNYVMAADSYFPITYKANILENLFNTTSVIWVIVFLAITLMLAVIYFMTLHEMKDAEQLRDNICLSDKITSPAVYGIIKPRIILPTSYESKDIDLILLHEKMHIRRADNLWRLLAFLIVSAHWFNPLSWVFLRLFLTDLELSCDECVLVKLDNDRSKEYARSLLESKESANVFTSAFGGAKIRIRIENILSFKRITWISFIVIGVLIMPLCIKLLNQFALAGGSVLATGTFFVLEILFEQKVVVTTAETVTKLEDWQMFLCIALPERLGETVTTYKTQTAVEILMGNYNPAFKLHFYMISVVLILSILNCLYGIGQMIQNGDKKRLKSLILQSVCSLIFLGLCILACFTAFWRDGSIQVSPLSATLMAVFFIILGVTTGVYAGSFFLGKRNIVSIWVPALIASVMTFFMYVGEMILLNGHLYRLGTGFIFDSIPGIVLSPIDLLIIVVSGCVTALILSAVQ